MRPPPRPRQGADAVIETAPITTTGTYTIAVSDLNGNIGQYSIQATLNAVVKIGDVERYDPHGSRPDGLFLRTGHRRADRLAALGTLVGGPSFGDALAVEAGDVLLINQTSGKVEKTFTSPDFSGLTLFDVALGPDNTFYVLGDLNNFTGVIVHMDLQGNTLGDVYFAGSDPGNYYSPEGFGFDPKDGSFWVPLPNSASLLHVDSAGNLLSLNAVTEFPEDAAVGPDGKIYLTQAADGRDLGLRSHDRHRLFLRLIARPINLTWSAAGDLWVGDFNNGAEEFDTRGPHPDDR